MVENLEKQLIILLESRFSALFKGYEFKRKEALEALSSVDLSNEHFYNPSKKPFVQEFDRSKQYLRLSIDGIINLANYEEQTPRSTRRKMSANALFFGYSSFESSPEVLSEKLRNDEGFLDYLLGFDNPEQEERDLESDLILFGRLSKKRNLETGDIYKTRPIIVGKDKGMLRHLKDWEARNTVYQEEADLFGINLRRVIQRTDYDSLKKGN